MAMHSDRLELAKQHMRQKIEDTAPGLPDMSDASKTELMELVLGTSYMMLVDMLEDPRQSWSTAARANAAYIYRELAKELMKPWPAP